MEKREPKILKDNLSWLRPWVGISGLGLGAFLAIPTIAKVIEQTAASLNAQSLATIVAALIGFSGVIITTRAGFQNLITSQENQAKREREDREHRASMQEKAKQDEIAHAKSILISSLQAELSMLLDHVHAQESVLYVQKKLMEHAKDDPQLSKQEVAIVKPLYSTPIYDANIDKLGLLGFDLGSDVIKIYSGTKFTADSTKIDPASAFLLYNAMHTFHLNWSEEIVHVVKRLNWGIGRGSDPGSLYEFRNKRNASNNNAKATGTGSES